MSAASDIFLETISASLEQPLRINIPVIDTIFNFGMMYLYYNN